MQKVTVSEFSQLNEQSIAEVMEMIHKGTLCGEEINGVWYVVIPSQKKDEMETSNSSYVIISDISMPFWSMVVFMVKAAIASIPAFIILTIIGTVVFAVVGGIFGGMSRF